MDEPCLTLYWYLKSLECPTGVEPVSSPWQGDMIATIPRTHDYSGQACRNRTYELRFPKPTCYQTTPMPEKFFWSLRQESNLNHIRTKDVCSHYHHGGMEVSVRIELTPLPYERRMLPLPLRDRNFLAAPQGFEPRP